MTDTDRPDDVVVTRSEERLRADVLRLPVRRAVIRKVIVEEVHTIALRREELRVEYEDVDVADASLLPSAPFEPLDLVLHEERVATVVVPTERVRVRVEQVVDEQRISGTVRVERFDVVDGPLPEEDETSGGRHRA